MSKPVKDQEIEQIATTFPHDREVGKAHRRSDESRRQGRRHYGRRGQSAKTEIEKVQGMKLTRRLRVALLVTDPERMETVWKTRAVIITDKKVSALNEILPF